MGTRRDAPQSHSPVGLRGAGPEDPQFERVLETFRGVEVRRHKFLPNEAEIPGFKGHLVTLHLGGPTRGEFRQGEIEAEVTETRGNVMVVPAGVPARQVLFDVSEAVNVLLEDRLVSRVAEEEAGVDPDRLEILGTFGTRDARAARIMRSFLSELEAGGRLGGANYAEALSYELAVHLLRYHSSLGRDASRRLAHRQTSGLSKGELETALEFMNDNLSQGFSLGELAGEVGLSPHRFARLFRLSTGLAPHQYTVRRRAEKARDLLLKGSPPALAAQEAGFYDQSHLGRHFKRLFGTSPQKSLAQVPENGKNVL